ncbi:homologous-pairing protein 2 homolog [Brevipalpus obovatus]|uniref:homologous-pairing protein 2 homolog n=1 Tax=Brevipalpus obovatus TaxID=246614 RepID=UPI003D9ECFB3
MMAEKADKTTKIVFEFLLKQNRPYSINEVQNHTKEGKAGITRALTLLVEEGKIIEKTYGKQKIYYVNQDLLETLSEEELSKLKNEIQELNKKVSDLSEAKKSLECNIKNIHSLPSMAELKQQELQLIEEIESFQVNPSQNIDVNYDPDEFKKIKRIHQKVTAERQKRKSIVEEALDMMLESTGKTKDELIEDIGLEFP